MTNEEFRKHGYQVIDWIADYLKNIEQYPVKSQVSPGEIMDSLPDRPPAKPEPFDLIMNDLDEKIMPGVTHWQHPGFHAFFNANNSYPSILAEALTAGMGIQGMIWETSPAAAELEEQVMEWFKQMMSLPKDWTGVIQDTASTATLAALLSAREWKTNYEINEKGFHSERLRGYCSAETHSSIEKGVKIAGFGKSNLVKIPVKDDQSMDVALLEKRVIEDLTNGYTPCIIVSTQGTTGTLAVDHVESIGRIAKKYNIWHHVDAAWAGNTFILSEFQHYTRGFDKVDSFVFNPHKWLFTNFDCSAYFVKSKDILLNTFEILPEYLKTGTRGKVNDYRDWGIPLGRRFRALKLWFVIRSYGVEGLQKKLRRHVKWAKWLEQQVIAHSHFELMATNRFSTVILRYNPGNLDEKQLNARNKAILASINKEGKAYVTHTKINHSYVIRVNIGGTYTEFGHVEKIWQILKKNI